MQIEFRKILNPAQSNRVIRNLVCEYQTLLTFEYEPDRKDPQPFDFKGEELLTLANESESYKAYLIGVEQEENNKLKYTILDNFQDLILVTKKTYFQLYDIVPIIK